MSKSLLEARFLKILEKADLTGFVREYRFHPVRRWRFDFAWTVERVAVEIDGGTFVRGAHTRGTGFQEDCEKRNEAQLGGWIVLHFTRAMFPSAPGIIRRALEGRRREDEC